MNQVKRKINKILCLLIVLALLAPLGASGMTMNMQNVMQSASLSEDYTDVAFKNLINEQYLFSDEQHLSVDSETFEIVWENEQYLRSDEQHLSMDNKIFEIVWENEQYLLADEQYLSMDSETFEIVWENEQYLLADVEGISTTETMPRHSEEAIILVPELAEPMSTILTINPTTNWTNISAAGGAQRTVTVTTNASSVGVTGPGWLMAQSVVGGIRFTALQNTIAAPRSGTVTFTAGTVSRSFTVSQLAAATTLTINPTTNWTSIPAAGGAQRTVTVTSNAPSVGVTGPGWLTAQNVAGGIRFTATQNPIAAPRSGTVTFTAGTVSRSFTVSQLAAATTLTINPTTNWTNISAAGGAQRTVTVTSNAPSVGVTGPGWLTAQNVAGGVRFTATQNPIAAPRSGTVTFTAGTVSRSFTVSQLAAATTLTINPTTNWTNIPAAGGAQRTVTVTTNAVSVGVTGPGWLTAQNVAGGFRLTATQNTGSARTGTVSVTAGNLTRSFTVSQLGNTILTFHGGFGVPALQQLQRQPGTAIGTMPSNPTRPGFDFAGWFTNMTGGTQITSNSIVPNSYTRFFAQWTPRNVILTFAGNNGTPSSQSITRQARSTTGAMPTTPSRAGFTFVGWFDTSAATGGTNFASNSPVPINNTTYWARWTPNSNVVITFNGNGGTPVAQPLAKQPGTNMGSMPSNPTRAGFIFAGWFNTPATTGGNQITSSSIVPTVSTTYWARWTVNPTWVWNCDSGHVGFWPSTINVHTHTLGPVSDTFVYHYRMLQAQREWNNALNVSIVGVTQATNAQIRSFGGTRAHIDAFRNEGPSGWAGLAEFAPNTPEQVITVSGVNRGVHRFFDQSRIFTVERANADEVLMVAIHELGHALGYWGHSSSSQDVMWPWVSTNTTLQTNERRHMRQIYDFFR